VLVLAAGLLVVILREGPPPPGVTREHLRATFEADTAALVYAWDPDDPRPEPQRREALFEFLYQGYDSSAWVPQSSFDQNWLTQAVAGDADTIVGERIGLVRWRANGAVMAYGMAPNPDAGKPLSWAVNCLACHTAEIDGVAYLGAGGKVLDEKVLADTVRLVTAGAGPGRHGGDAERAMAAHAHDVMNRHHHEKIDPLTRARSTAFAASHVEMHLRAHGGMPDSSLVGRGDAKTPSLWHTAAKLPFGRWYCDGSFHGPLPLMASSMELELDTPFDKLVSSVIPAIRKDFQDVVRHLRPPPYPYPIDEALAARGKALFHDAELGCARCHGTYDGNGNVVWTGTHADVGTDGARAGVVSEAFVAAFESSPLAAEGRLERSGEYAATPLTGVWANYPYLHNGSVPTLHHLLGPASERPRVFSVWQARHFDRERVGQKLLPPGPDEGLGAAELLARHGEDRDWFNAARPGCGNGGHDFWDRIRTDANRRALIEYLKTL
jgi:mono/diheme cytochrome c family protein